QVAANDGGGADRRRPPDEPKGKDKPKEEAKDKDQAKDGRTQQPPEAGPKPDDDPDVLTVSRKKEGGGKYRTIGEALAKVLHPGMTIRILDRGTYTEFVHINKPNQQAGLTLEAVQDATLVVPPQALNALLIENVPRVTICGLHLFVDRPGCFLCTVAGNC